MRDPKKLRVFQKADAAVVAVYRATRKFPVEERYGLQLQLRRAAVSVANSLVEGCARRTTGVYLQFVDIAAGSASETRFLVDLGHRLGYLCEEDRNRLVAEYSEILAGCIALQSSLADQP